MPSGHGAVPSAATVAITHTMAMTHFPSSRASLSVRGGGNKEKLKKLKKKKDANVISHVFLT